MVAQMISWQVEGAFSYKLLQLDCQSYYRGKYHISQSSQYLWQ